MVPIQNRQNSLCYESESRLQQMLKGSVLVQVYILTQLSTVSGLKRIPRLDNQTVSQYIQSHELLPDTSSIQIQG